MEMGSTIPLDVHAGTLNTSTGRTVSEVAEELGCDLVQGLASVGSWLEELQEQIRAFNAYYLESLADVQAEYSVCVASKTVRTMTQHEWFPDFARHLVQVRLLADAFASDPKQAHQANQ